MVKYFTKVIMV